ncbi:MAG TPA: hypothetical protein VLG41_11355 [Hydrogenophaga sp.]|uniref:hypothetical protein n=1 Tax=Hydrogenophaga sp. TaxID=1904254 RepID=UPI002BA8377F|nr:hypothetical protein [Hydrogenophaga sp.]HSX93512.1 hypothetical protein [Hydrogenophaga sp.]
MNDALQSLGTPEPLALVAPLWLATNHPLVFAVLLVVIVLAMWWITWTLFRFLHALWRRVLGRAQEPA